MSRPKPRTFAALTNRSQPFLMPSDGNSPEARRFRDLVSLAEAERGGPESLNIGQSIAIRTWAGLIVRLDQMHVELACGKSVDAEEMGQLGDRIDRQLRRMGSPKAPVKQDLRTYLAGKAKP